MPPGPLLKIFQLNIDTASSGAETIEKIKNGNVYDIIFLDHMMPEMDGIETHKHLRDLGYTQPIVALTANVIAGQAEVFIKNGFDDFVAKPIDIRLLTTVLNKYVRDKQPPEIIAEARLQQENECLTDMADSQSAEKSQIFADVLENGVDGIDIAKGFERYHGDEKVYLGILRAYVSDVRSLIAGLPAVESNTLSDYKIIVHGIKGMSLGIFADHLGESARILEIAAEDGDFAFIESNNQVFVDEALKLVDDLDQLLKSIEDEIPRPVKQAPDKDVLLNLLSACMVYDMHEVDEIMTEITRYKYESDDGLVEWLREKVSLMYFQEVADKLNELI